MFPGMDPRQVQQAMKKLGIKQEEIPASEVIIRTVGRDIVITNPQVLKVNMMGQDTFQISGNIEERSAQMEISADDIQTVVSQTGVSEEKAKDAIEAANGDLAQAIMDLKG